MSAEQEQSVRQMTRAAGRASIAELVASIEVETDRLQPDGQLIVVCIRLKMSNILYHLQTITNQRQ